MSNKEDTVKEEECLPRIGEQKIPPPQIPEHLIFDILTRISAELLVKNFKLMCKSWNGYFSDNKFISQNAIRNKCELLVQVPYLNGSSNYRTKSMLMDERELDYKLKHYSCSDDMPRFACIRFRKIEVKLRFGRISSSCNGVLLVNDPKDEGWLYLINLITKCSAVLPPCPTDCQHHTCGSAIGFDPLTNKYKVVHLHCDSYGYEIFTLGSSNNAWKVIPGPFHDHPDDRTYYNLLSKFHWTDPVTTINGQFMHWFVGSNKFLITMDVSTEKSRKTYLPNDGKGIGKDKYALVEMRGKLSCICSVSDTEIDVWVLEDFYKDVWVKKHTVDAGLISYTNLDDKYRKSSLCMSKLMAVATLRNGEVIMFKHKEEKSKMFLYDMKRKEMKQFKMKMRPRQRFIPH